MSNLKITDLASYLQRSLSEAGFSKLTDVQQKTIPHAMNHEDIFAQAPTGSGKTAAYLIPILEQLEVQKQTRHHPQALIMVPTRELAMQIADTARLLLKYREGIRCAVLTGGIDMNAQVRSFSKGADIVIATPSRLLDHIRRHTFKSSDCHFLVLDEADVMMTMGFYEDVTKIVNTLPEHETMLFSATYNEQVTAASKDLLLNPFECHIETDSVIPQKISYYYAVLDEKEKPDLLFQLLKQNCQTLVFCNTIRTCDYLAELLKARSLPCETIHSEMDPKIRRTLMKRFRNNEYPILIATDVASRGLDINNMDLVISYDCPSFPEEFLHRTGRTGRAGSTGQAVLFLTPKESGYIREMETLTGSSCTKISGQKKHDFTRRKGSSKYD